MMPSKDFERDRAKQWDESSSAAAPSDAEHEPRPSPSSTRNPAFVAQNARIRSASFVPTPLRHLHNTGNQQNATINHATGRPAAGSSGYSSSSSAERTNPFKTCGEFVQAALGGSTNNNVKGNRQTSQGGGYTVVSREIGRRQRHYTNPTFKTNTIWAEPAALKTNREAFAETEAAVKKAETSKYLQAPDQNTYFPAIGYYIWPKPGTHPAELLGGAELSKLNSIRTSQQVYIDWDSQKECLRVSSERSESHVATALRGIRQAVKNVGAENAYSSPLYILVPPNAELMTKIVRPASCQIDHNGHKTRLIGMILGGDPLSINEKLEWKSGRNKRLEKNQTDFVKHLRGITEKLVDFMPWMRMRVHFGHVCLTKFHAKFANSESNFEDFVKMMTSARVNGTLDRRLDGSFAKNILQKIHASPKDFRPGESRFPSLEHVEPKHTVIISLKPDNGDGLRLEGDIDYSAEGREEGKHMLFQPGTGTGQFQAGTINLFYANTRNKRADITIVDIESGFDWTLEIIDDGIKPELTSSMAALINNSVTGTTTFKRDSLGFPYPGASPKYTHGSSVEEVVIRSVYAYKFGKSGYNIEIAVYRTWAKGVMTREPRIESSVSMYHQVWEWAMAPVYDTTKARDWDPQLDCFFAQVGQEGGISSFMEETRFLQHLLVEAGNI